MKKDREYLKIDVYKIVAALWGRIWAVILATVLTAGIFCGITVFFVQPEYTADTMLYVNNKSSAMGDPQSAISQGDLNAAQSLIDTYGVILKSRSTLNEVIELSGVKYSYKDLAKMISSEPINGTELFHIEVTSTDPKEAELLANTIASVLPNKIASIVDGSSVRIIDNAVLPVKKSGPSISLNTFLGGLLGAFLACAAIVVKELKDDQIHNTDYILETYEQPILAVVPELKDKKSSTWYGGHETRGNYEISSDRVQNKKAAGNGKTAAPRIYRHDEDILGGNLNFAAAETYKLLRTNLEFSAPEDRNCQVIGLTSAMRGEGKTTTAINTAYTFAQTGRKVLLVEADMRLPNIAKRLGLYQSPGLSNLLSRRQNTQGFLQKSSLIENMWVIAAGDTPPNPAELLGSAGMVNIINKLAESFDVILVDLPPVGIVADALAVSKVLDGIVVVSRQNMCTRRGLDEVIRKLDFVHSKILGFVVTGSDIDKKDYRYKKSDHKNKHGYDDSYESAKR